MRILNGPIQRFAASMQERLDANADKGHWGRCSKSYLLRRLGEEKAELAKALSGPSKKWEAQAIRREAADVANFAMMIAENFGDCDDV